MHIGTILYTKLFGKLVGTDQFGNKYYRSRKKKDGFHIGKPKTERRWVVYNGMDDPSKVPPQWHGWLHYLTDKQPKNSASSKSHSWEQPHIPNLTGTDGAYFPAGHENKGGRRNKALGDYEAWNPDQ